jgi:hypothetical protein
MIADACFGRVGSGQTDGLLWEGHRLLAQSDLLRELSHIAPLRIDNGPTESQSKQKSNHPRSGGAPILDVPGMPGKRSYR